MTQIIRHCRRALATVGVAALTCVSLGTNAAVAGPGDHIELGASTELVPEIDLGLQYRSNILQRESNRVGGIALQITPGARITYDTPRSKVTFSGDYKLVKYFTRVTRNADQFTDFDVNFRGDFLRDAPVGFYLRERPVLINNNAEDFGNTPFHTRFRNDLGAGLSIRPGPILQINVGGLFEYDNILVPPGSLGSTSDVRAYNQRIGGGAEWDAQYRFLPRTAIVLEGNYRYYDWQRNFIQSENNPGIAQPDSQQFRILAGLRGRVTERLVVVGELGYGASPYSVESVQRACPDPTGIQCTPSVAAQFDAKLSGIERLLASLQVSYQVAEGQTLTVGYRKDFDDVFFTNYMAYNRLYGTFQTRIGTRALGGLSASIRQESYRGEVRRDDVFMDLSGTASYKVQEWVVVNGSLRYQQRISQLSDVNYYDVQPRIFVTLSY